jgi:PRTRC genetic system ThiF family protein
MKAFDISAPFELAQRKINILVLGCGGNGSNFIQSSLYRIHTALLGLGHPFGIKVWIADGANVSETNTLRSAFYPQDVSHNKAYLLASRMNMCGLNMDFEAIQKNMTVDDVYGLVVEQGVDFVVGAVDDAEFRVELVDYFKNFSHNQFKKDCMYLDMGNSEETGNIVLGHLIKNTDHHPCKIPNVVDLFPEIRTIKTNRKRSCSAAESFGQQGVLVNQQCALLAGRILNDYLLKPSINTHGVLFDLGKLTSTPIRINTNNWLVYGYEAPEFKVNVEKEIESVV